MKELLPAQELTIAKQYQEGLREYQASRELKGFSKLMGWQMGTGKTPGTLVYCDQITNLLRTSGDDRFRLPVLIISPAAIKTQWREEADDFIGIKDFEFVILDGTPTERENLLRFIEMFKPRFVIMNYELSVIHQQWIQNQEWLGLVIDEAHAIKNDSALRSRAGMSVCAGFSLMLTGTPVDNRPPDLYNLLKRVDPGAAFYRKEGKTVAPSRKCPVALSRLAINKARSSPYYYRETAKEKLNIELKKIWGKVTYVSQVPYLPEECVSCRYYHGDDKYTGSCEYNGASKGVAPVSIRYHKSSPYWGSRKAFEDRYCEWEQSRFGRKFVRAIRTAELHERLKPWMTRLKRSDVSDLGRLTYQYIGLDMGPEQAKLYRQVESGILAHINPDETVSEIQIKSKLTEFLWLERVAATTPYDFWTAMQKARPNYLGGVPAQTSRAGVKQEWLEDFVDGLNGGDKVIIVTQWRTVADPLMERLKEHNPLLIRGEMNDRERQKSQDLFNSSPDHKVMIITRAGFEGLNLQKGVGPDDTIHVVFTDVSWVPKHITQPIGRAYRLGLEGRCWVWFVYCRNTIDEHKIGELRKKQVYIDEIVEGRQTQTVDLFNITSMKKLMEYL